MNKYIIRIINKKLSDINGQILIIITTVISISVIFTGIIYTFDHDDI